MKSSPVRGALVAVLTGLLLLVPLVVDAQAVRGTSRGIVRGATRSVSRAWSRLLRREAARDATTAAKPLTASRTVYRYTTAQRARREATRGLPPGTHMTSRGGPGRPLSPEVAMPRYGLPIRPEVRETILLPSGTLVRRNKVWRGRPGVGELTSPRRMRPSVIRRVLRQE